MKALLIAGLVSLSAMAADGPSVGGGGDVIILPNDTVVLADPFIDSGARQPNNMPPLRALNPRILAGITSYQKVLSKFLAKFIVNHKSDIEPLIATLAVRKNDLRFYGVQNAEELNNFCAPGGRKIYKLPNGAQVQQVACTAGNETFLVEPLFTRLSLRDQSLLLIHERLTTLRDQYGGKNYSAIARFTTGLNVYLNLYRDQAKEKFEKLNETETKQLTDFYVATEEIELRDKEVTENSFQWMAHPYGGGPVHLSSDVDPSALISLNTFIPGQAMVGQNAKVINLITNLSSKLRIEAGALVKNAYFNVNDVFVGANSEVVNSRLTYSQHYTTSGYYRVPVGKPEQGVIRIGENVKILNSKIAGHLLTFAKDVLIDNSQIQDNENSKYLADLNVGEKVSIKNSKFVMNDIEIGNDVIFSNTKINYPNSVKKIAANQDLTDLSLSQEIDDSYFPENVEHKGFEETIHMKEVSFWTGESMPRSNGKLIHHYEAQGNTADFEGEYRLNEKTGIRNPRYNYSYFNLKVKVSVTKLISNTDPKLKMLDETGLLVNPGIFRGPYKIQLGDDLLKPAFTANLNHSSVSTEGNVLKVILK